MIMITTIIILYDVVVIFLGIAPLICSLALNKGPKSFGTIIISIK